MWHCTGAAAALSAGGASAKQSIHVIEGIAPVVARRIEQPKQHMRGSDRIASGAVPRNDLNAEVPRDRIEISAPKLRDELSRHAYRAQGAAV